jgi:hypothetical protein
MMNETGISSDNDRSRNRLVTSFEKRMEKGLPFGTVRRFLMLFLSCREIHYTTIRRCQEKNAGMRKISDHPDTQAPRSTHF